MTTTTVRSTLYRRWLCGRRIAVALMLAMLGADGHAAGPGDPTSIAPAADLLFRDFFEMPVGPRGLRPSPRLLALDGQQVRLRGYVAHQARPTADVFILSPLPVELGDADDGLADDLPPAIVFVHAAAPTIPSSRDIVQVTGRLSVGPLDEADGRVSQVRLFVDSTPPDAGVGPLPPPAAQTDASRGPAPRP